MNLEVVAVAIVEDLVADGWLCTQQDFDRVSYVVSRTRAISQPIPLPASNLDSGIPELSPAELAKLQGME